MEDAGRDPITVATVARRSALPTGRSIPLLPSASVVLTAIPVRSPPPARTALHAASGSREGFQAQPCGSQPPRGQRDHSREEDAPERDRSGFTRQSYQSGRPIQTGDGGHTNDCAE
jgi:hypothetical protein